MKQTLVAIVVVVFALSFTIPAFAQDKMQKEMKKEDKKMEMSKGEMSMGPMKSLTCDDACGFMIRSRDEKEIMSATKSHMKKHHKKNISDKDVKGMMKTEDTMK